MHNLVVAEYIIESDFPRSRSPTRIRSDLMMKCRNRPRFGAPECMEIYAGRLGLIIAEARPIGRLGPRQRGPIRPCQIRITVLDRLALLSVCTSGDASLGVGGVKRHARSIKTIVPAPLSRNLYK